MIRVEMPSQPEFGTLNIEPRTLNLEHPNHTSPLGGERIKVRGGTLNTQHPTSNIQHRTFKPRLSPRRGEDQGEGWNFEHPTSNIQHPTSEHSVPVSSVGYLLSVVGTSRCDV